MKYSRRTWLLTAGSAAAARGADPAYFPPPEAEGGWRRGTAGADIPTIDRAFDLIQRSSKNGGLLVVRRGSLVYERYFGLGHPEATPNLASCGKSFTSVAVGMLLAERPEAFPEGLNTRIFTPDYLPAEAFPPREARRAAIRLGHLLAMSGGIRGNNPGRVHGKEVTLAPEGPDGWPAMEDAMALGLKDGERNARTLWCEPGGGYSYATSSIHLASMVLRRVSGMELEDYLRRKLAGPLGWSTWGFGYKHAKLEHSPGGGGVAMRARDVLRFLYLLLHEGAWEGRQIIPRDYVRHCSRASRFNPHAPYSLQFDVNTDGHLRGAPRQAYWKSGSGGHAMYVVPPLDMVAFKLGGRDGQYGSSDTGLPAASSSPPNRYADDGRWSASMEAAPALRETLRLLTAAAR